MRKLRKMTVGVLLAVAAYSALGYVGSDAEARCWFRRCRPAKKCSGSACATPVCAGGVCR